MPYDASFLQEFLRYLTSFFATHRDVAIFYFPLGVLGAWRWSTWLAKECLALFYHPKKPGFHAAVSIITPVYNEKPALLLKALGSWKRNDPAEIIAVIDHTDKACIQVFKKFQKNFPATSLIITKIPGKRPALAAGILAAKSPIVALVDSDTVWKKNVLFHALAPFKDPKVAGVGTRQNVLKPTSLAEKIFDMGLDLRYADEHSYLAAVGSTLTCISGRTAFYRRQAVLPLLDAMVNEKFLGQPAISGEDKRLTYLVQEAGWKVTYQSTARVFTEGEKNLLTLYKQRTRHSRNSWRADLVALKDGWVFKHPALAFHLIDRSLQPFVALVSPVYLIVSIFSGLWLGAVVIVAWWLVSRSVKLYPHFRRRPQDIVVLPQYILSTFAFAVVKIYALFTLNTQGWITRWHKDRLPQSAVLHRVPPAAGVALVVFFLVLVALPPAQRSFFNFSSPFSQAKSAALIQTTSLALAANSTVLGATSSDNELVTLYYVEKGDTIYKVAAKFNLTPQELLTANSSRLPNWSRLELGDLLVIPSASLVPSKAPDYNFYQKYQPEAVATYDESSQTITVEGRGTIVTLRDIQRQLGDTYVKELSPQEWYLETNLLITNGVTLKLAGDEVRSLKLKSSPDGYVWLKAQSGVLDFQNTKITSWDEKFQDFDREPKDGRSFIEARSGSIFVIKSSELAYLGFANGTGTFAAFSAHLPLPSQDKYILTGLIENTSIHDSVSGLNLQGTKNVKVLDNHFLDNKTGLQLKYTSLSQIKGNLFQNNHTGLGVSESESELIEANQFSQNTRFGLTLDSNSQNNMITKNEFSANEIAVNVSGNENVLLGNTISHNYTGILFADTASGNTLRANELAQNLEYDVLTKNATHANYLVTD